MEKIDTKFSSRLRYAMQYSGLRATDLSELTGLSRATISEYLKGRYVPKQKNMGDLAKALHVQPNKRALPRREGSKFLDNFFKKYLFMYCIYLDYVVIYNHRKRNNEVEQKGSHHHDRNKQKVLQPPRSRSRNEVLRWHDALHAD